MEYLLIMALKKAKCDLAGSPVYPMLWNTGKIMVYWLDGIAWQHLPRG
jgi:hypothetical protein